MEMFYVTCKQNPVKLIRRTLYNATRTLSYLKFSGIYSINVEMMRFHYNIAINLYWILQLIGGSVLKEYAKKLIILMNWDVADGFFSTDTVEVMFLSSKNCGSKSNALIPNVNI